MRRKPYTVIGLRRLKCANWKCNNRAEHQWQACADGGQFRPVCAECDIVINTFVLYFMFGEKKAKPLIKAYRKEMGR